MDKTNLLFLCTGNSCRSQMAEGFARKLLSDKYEIYSAGVEAHGMNEHAVAVMKEIGIDISGQYSKTVDDVPWNNMDVIITLCGHAAETCPSVPATTRHIHWGVDDPANAAGSREEIRKTYRRVRDELQEKIREWGESANLS